MTDSLRLFFALLPDEATRQRLAAASAALSFPPDARLVAPGHYHLTLAFIGTVPASQLPVLQQLGALQCRLPFSLTFSAYEYWPKPEVVVATVRNIPDRVQDLWERLHRDLVVHGWALTPKRLRPHVTLARKVAQQPVLPALTPFDWIAREFCLMRSDTSGSQSAYTVVATWPLLDKGETQ